MENYLKFAPATRDRLPFDLLVCLPQRLVPSPQLLR
jgi:hypothetical protein